MNSTAIDAALRAANPLSGSDVAALALAELFFGLVG